MPPLLTERPQYVGEVPPQPGVGAFAEEDDLLVHLELVPRVLRRDAQQWRRGHQGECLKEDEPNQYSSFVVVFAAVSTHAKTRTHIN